MDNLTTQQIQDFNNPLAFARTREARVGQSVIGEVNNRPIATNGIEGSYSLVLGALERLETLEGNLNTMLDLANSGKTASGSDRKIQEIYGKLRSLSAGFDQIIEAVSFDGRPIFTGEDLSLNLGAGVRPLEYEASRLLTYGDNGLGLSNAVPTGDAYISYSVDDQIVNDAYDIIGLDISDAAYRTGGDPAKELETGSYKLKIRYEGPDSKVELFNKEGALIESKDGVDLSGSGQEWLDFDVGIRLTFSKDSIFSSFDKWDYEGSGPAYLSATLNYERKDAHVLTTSDSTEEESVAFMYAARLSNTNGALALSEPKITVPDSEAIELDSGVYTVSVEYRGAESIVQLHDALGRLKSFEYGVDLSTGEDTEIDFGNGLSFTIQNSGFDQQGSTLKVPVDYRRSKDPIEDFDFREYAKRIEQAIEVVREQQTAMQEAQTRIEEVNNLRNLASTSAIPDAATLMGSGALNILSGGGFNTNPFDPSTAMARVNLLSSQLFSTTTALPAQANQSSEALAQLQLSSADGWLGSYA